MLLVMLYVLLFKSDNCTIRVLLVVVMVIFIIIFVADEYLRAYHEFHWTTTIFLIFFGTMNSMFATLDIWEDLVARHIHESDASRFAKKFPILSARAWGLIWWILSVILLTLQLWSSVYLAQFGATSCVFKNMFAK